MRIYRFSWSEGYPFRSGRAYRGSSSPVEGTGKACSRQENTEPEGTREPSRPELRKAYLGEAALRGDDEDRGVGHVPGARQRRLHVQPRVDERPQDLQPMFFITFVLTFGYFGAKFERLVLGCIEADLSVTYVEI